MGSGRWDASAYDTHRTVNATATKSVTENFTSRSLKKVLDPKGVAIRESRDSDDNPQSNAIIVALDVTGSMGVLANVIAKEGLGTLFTEILDRKPVTDPHVMFMAIGDVDYSSGAGGYRSGGDNAPLQVSQFEADIRVVEQLADIFVEGGGGGNRTESYNLPWYFAALHTSIDCKEKRGTKGYLFTIGDEEAPYDLTVDHIERVLGYKPEQVLDNKQLLTLVEQSYHVFHLIVEEGSHMRVYPDRVKESWKNMLGERAILLSDHTKLAEVIVSLIQVTEGADAKSVSESWSGDTSLVVSRAVSGMTTTTGSGPVARL